VKLLNAATTEEVLDDVQFDLCQPDRGRIGSAGQVVCDTKIKLKNARILRAANGAPRMRTEGVLPPAPTGTQSLSFSFESITYETPGSTSTWNVLDGSGDPVNPRAAIYDFNRGKVPTETELGALGFNAPTFTTGELSTTSILQEVDKLSVAHILSVASGGAGGPFPKLTFRMWTTARSGTIGGAAGRSIELLHYIFTNAVVDSVVIGPHDDNWGETFSFRALKTEWVQNEGNVTATFPR